MTSFKSENGKHLRGFKTKSKYRCPKCDNGLNIDKPKFMVICSKCQSVINEEEIKITI